MGLLALVYHSSAIEVAGLLNRHSVDLMQVFSQYLGFWGLLRFEQQPIDLDAVLEVAQTKALHFAVEWAERNVRRIRGRVLHCWLSGPFYWCYH